MPPRRQRGDLAVAAAAAVLVLMAAAAVGVAAGGGGSGGGGGAEFDYRKLSGIIIPGFASTQLRAWSVLDCPYSPFDFNPLDSVWLDTAKVSPTLRYLPTLLRFSPPKHYYSTLYNCFFLLCHYYYCYLLLPFWGLVRQIFSLLRLAHLIVTTVMWIYVCTRTLEGSAMRSVCIRLSPCSLLCLVIV
jgi:hypothetical protein